MTTRDTTRNNIRTILRDFSELDTVATAGIDSSATILPVNNPNRYSVGDRIIIGSEHMFVRVVDPENSELSVTRGWENTTAVAHVSTDPITINPEFTDPEINLCINYGVNQTFFNRQTGDAGIWIEVSDTTLSTTTTIREYTIPSGLATVNIIEVADANGFFQINRHWRLSGAKIVFTRSFAESDKTIRIQGVTYQGQLSDDITAWILADEALEFIELISAYRLLEFRLGPRMKTTDYSAAVNSRAGQPDQIISYMNYLKRRAEEVRAREGKPIKSGWLAIAHR